MHTTKKNKKRENKTNNHGGVEPLTRVALQPPTKTTPILQQNSPKATLQEENNDKRCCRLIKDLGVFFTLEKI
jgi:hypothetical protein